MPEQQTAPYGTWKSPITAESISTGMVGFGDMMFDDADIYFIENRPQERGRSVIMRRKPDGEMHDVTPAGFNARTRVHEYGGGAFVAHNGEVYFSNFTDNRLYRQRPDADPVPLTPEGAMRYADIFVDTGGDRLLCVREDHSAGDDHRKVVNTIVSIPLSGESEGEVLVSGHDFYSNPRISPDGGRVAWLAWNLPNMPWDGTELWTAELLDDGSLGTPQLVAGGPAESVFQPEWSPEGTLHFVSDRTGWWNLYRLRGGEAEPMAPMDMEFGTPQWGFALTMYAFESEESILCIAVQRGESRLMRLNTVSLEVIPFELPYTDLFRLRVSSGHALFTAGAPTEPAAIVLMDLISGDREILRRSNMLDIDSGYISAGRSIEFPTEGGLTAFGFYYAPANRDFIAPAGELPPLIVISHGGPTGNATLQMNLNIQFWTSRGFAVLDVNYGGSTGFGRAYRERMNGKWGLVDVEDCANAARYLVKEGLADPARLAIRGGSAGGYTTLRALTTSDLFGAGASYYGVSDLELLDEDGHKFESGYNQTLLGPDIQRAYRERSPIYDTDKLSCPVIFFQGLDDKVVPPNQAEKMVDALRAKGLPVAYVPFEGEGHGFRRAENIRRALESELYFYSRIFGFTPADDLEPVEIMEG